MNLKDKWDSLVPSSIRKDLEYITQTINKQGGEVFVVGGAVRDLYMNKIPKEFDLATSLPPLTVKSLFPKVIETGIKHGTVTILTKNGKYEVTTYRAEFGYSDFRRPDKVEFRSNLEEDLKRRDFTMNALALNVKDLNLIDLHGGINDINHKLIRAIGNPIQRFTEDGLRPIRAIRFKTVLGFQIEENTYKAIYETRQIIQKIAVERFHDELYKILETPKPFVGIRDLIYNKIFSLFLSIRETNNSSILEELDFLKTKSVPLKLAYLWKYFLDSNQLPFSTAQKLCSELKLSREDTKHSLFWLEFLYELENLEFNDLNIKQILSKIKTFQPESFSKLVDDFLAVLRVRKTPERFEEIKKIVYNIIQSKTPLTLKDLAINGDFIAKNFPNIPKEEYGNLLKKCLQEVLLTGQNSKEYFYNFIGRIYEFRK
ncbi:MAG: hypothetical protein N3A69_04600 [Leptospiraceae bacterium]|nr:hypothetical protein [Leptospiraceae bacterium]